MNISTENLPDFVFMSKIVIPLEKSLALVSLHRSSSNINQYIGLNTVDIIRSLANLNYEDKDLTEFNKKFTDLGDGLITSWGKICQDENWYKRAGVELDYKTVGFEKENDPSCSDELLKSIKAYFSEQKQLSTRPLSRDRPYGPVLSAWLLVASGELETAFRDLDDWVRTFSSTRRGDKGDRATVDDVYRLRVLINIDKLYTQIKGISRDVELDSLTHFNYTIQLFDNLLQGYNSKNVLADLKKISANSESGIIDQCDKFPAEWSRLQYFFEDGQMEWV